MVVVTFSSEHLDIEAVYELGANSYKEQDHVIPKPISDTYL